MIINTKCGVSNPRHSFIVSILFDYESSLQQLEKTNKIGNWLLENLELDSFHFEYGTKASICFSFKNQEDLNLFELTFS